MGEPERRVMRVPIPVDLIREMDAVILQGVGGYSTRAEFIVDAIQERVLELTIGEEDAGPPPQLRLPPARSAPAGPDAGTTPALEGASATDSGTTALLAVPRGHVVSGDAGVDRPEGKPLFGLHNRDYPSLWALRHLALMAHAEPVPIESYYEAVLRAAWEHGSALMGLEQQTGVKCTALFPTNPDKKKTAESAFHMFAVGEYRQDKSRSVITSGPLFEWRAVRATAQGKALLIGLSDLGWELLDFCTGVSVEEPHPPAAALGFLAHLAVNAEPDWLGFVQVLTAVGDDGANRQEVLDRFRKTWPDWTDNEVSTNAAGYVARAREWGLLERKQVQGRYHLTPFGHDQFTHNVKGVRP